MAALALTPMLLHAQANSPAQTQSSPTLQSKLVQPNELNASEADHGTVHTVTPRISTGVVAPKLIHTIAIESDTNPEFAVNALDRKTLVTMVVDTTGKPTELKIAGSIPARVATCRIRLQFPNSRERNLFTKYYYE